MHASRMKTRLYPKSISLPQVVFAKQSDNPGDIHGRCLEGTEEGAESVTDGPAAFPRWTQPAESEVQLLHIVYYRGNAWDCGFHDGWLGSHCRDHLQEGQFQTGSDFTGPERPTSSLRLAQLTSSISLALLPLPIALLSCSVGSHRHLGSRGMFCFDSVSSAGTVSFFKSRGVTVLSVGCIRTKKARGKYTQVCCFQL